MIDLATISDTETELVRFSLRDIRPAPENNRLYRPVSLDDPGIAELAESIEVLGLKEPIVVTQDLYIISGHRRHAACRLLAMETVTCRVEPIMRADPRFLIMLREFNRHRVKTFAEVAREQALDATIEPEDAYQALIEHRRQVGAVSGDFIEIRGSTRRAGISKAKRPMLEAIKRIVSLQREYWPLTDRSIHYDLLSDPPLRHANKPLSRYRNDQKCYKDTCDLLTRARLAGEIPFAAVSDPTRTLVTWDIHSHVATFLGDQLKDFLAGYYRDLMQSQPNHIEIVGEKNTIEGSIKPVALRYCIPYTIGRGYASLDPRWKMAERFRRSGKSKLIVLFLSDFDPEGENIAHSYIRSLRDDFGLNNVVGRKVCLTYEQVIERDLPQNFDAKKDGSRYKQFAASYGDRVHELEALPSAERSALLQTAIDEVLDTDAFNREIDAEKEDAANIARLRRRISPMLTEALTGAN